MDKCVGILGGMGPYATIMFQQYLFRNTCARGDCDHIHYVLDMNTKIPSRTRSILYGEESPLKGMMTSCANFEEWGVDFVVLPCNQASYWVPELRSKVKVEVVSIIEVVVEHLAKLAYRKVAVLGGYVTYHKELYRKELAAKGIELVRHGVKIQRYLEALIADIKRAGKPLVVMSPLLKEFSQDTVIILACTELSGLRTQHTCVNSSEVLARYVIKRAGGNLW